jgi:hypothetical protein
LTDVIVCGRCGARGTAGAAFCYSCGLSLVPPPAPPPEPWSSAPGPFGAPGPFSAPAPSTAPAPHGTPPAVPAPPSATATALPFGIVALVLAEIVICVVGIWVALDLYRWVAYGMFYEDTGEVPMDLFLAVVYSATSAAGFVVARGLWRLMPSAWMQACLLSIVLMGFDLISVLAWGLTTLDIIGFVAHLGVLAYLNLNSVRGLFGRPPTTFLQLPQ